MNISISQPRQKSTYKNIFPQIVEKSLLEHRKQATRENIKYFLNYLFTKMYQEKGRWIDVPKQTMLFYFPKNYQDKLQWLKDKNIVGCDDSYSTDARFCKSYTLTDKFLRLWLDPAVLSEYLCLLETPNPGRFGVSLETSVEPSTLQDGEGRSQESKLTNNTNQPSSSTSSLLSTNVATIPDGLLSTNVTTFPTTLPTENPSRFSVDIDKLKKVLPTLFPRLSRQEYNKQEIIAYHIQMNRLLRVVRGEMNESVSEKNGRHYDNVTMLQREIRACLLLNGQPYVGDVDLKCSAGSITTQLFKEVIPNAEMVFLEDLLRRPDTWIHLGNEAGIKGDKDKIKEKWNLFLMGCQRKNIGNQIYSLMRKHAPVFVSLLDAYKDVPDSNLSNDTNRIESSILHSQELKERLSGVSCHIIHDGIMFFGNKPAKQLMKGIARYILDEFQAKHGLRLSITVETTNGEKEII